MTIRPTESTVTCIGNTLPADSQLDRLHAMASFTFQAGNTRALLRLPLYALGALASFVVPRTDKLWVIGCGIGLGEGALPLYRLAREQLAPDVRVVWLATTDREL